ncbi:phosphoglycerate mutase [Xanthomonas massiliensis]|uniref:phosphoglycerate mutase n=1 Tax=Xanthomonas massiliensis TaxID=1720302 RepID=UPI00082600EE|nr:phosphoglycerate mutase [Xanthomonas massiliensis]
MATATLLLPARHRLGGGPLSAAVAAALGRAERGMRAAGEREQVQRHFDLVPAGWPVAALTRQLDAGDAAGSAWLRADPGHVAPDMQGARLLALGEAVQLEQADADALLPALKPLFGDAGLLLDAPVPSRWYLQVAPGQPLPTFAAPEQVLGDDLFDHLPQGDDGRRWRALLTEVQVLLHQHPWNRDRAARGLPAINTLWFWGAGSLPDAVRSGHAQVRSRDPLLRALARAAGVETDGDGGVDALMDLRHLRSLAQLDAEAIAPLLAAMARGELQRLELDFEDGAWFDLQPRQRWRFWRRPLAALDA